MSRDAAYRECGKTTPYVNIPADSLVAWFLSYGRWWGPTTAEEPAHRVVPQRDNYLHKFTKHLSYSSHKSSATGSEYIYPWLQSICFGSECPQPYRGNDKSEYDQNVQ